MNSKKKLQVFVSSTYQDLREERQAAVEAILSAGHIPAGMELFTAGDQSQMQVIKRWINESDVFLLILGGRYGSIEPETGKSYIHLEYEYALERCKPVFAVVVEKEHLEIKVKTSGSSVIEIANASKLEDFRGQVLSRLVKFWSDPRDIKLAIHETMADFSRRDDLAGWIPGSQSVNSGFVAEEIARLTKENTDLRKRLEDEQNKTRMSSGVAFNDLVRLLSSEPINLKETKISEPSFFEDDLRDATEEDNSFIHAVQERLKGLGYSEPCLTDALWILRNKIVPEIRTIRAHFNMRNVLDRLEFYGIVKAVRDKTNEHVSYALSNDGRKFLLRLVVALGGGSRDLSQGEPIFDPDSLFK